MPENAQDRAQNSVGRPKSLRNFYLTELQIWYHLSGSLPSTSETVNSSCMFCTSPVSVRSLSVEDGQYYQAASCTKLNTTIVSPFSSEHVLPSAITD